MIRRPGAVRLRALPSVLFRCGSRPAAAASARPREGGGAPRTTRRQSAGQQKQAAGLRSGFAARGRLPRRKRLTAPRCRVRDRRRALPLRPAPGLAFGTERGTVLAALARKLRWRRFRFHKARLNSGNTLSSFDFSWNFASGRLSNHYALKAMALYPSRAGEVSLTRCNLLADIFLRYSRLMAQGRAARHGDCR